MKFFFLRYFAAIATAVLFASCEKQPLEYVPGDSVPEAKPVEHFGVIRAWQSGENPRAASVRPGERLIVEVKNIQGWIERKIETQRIEHDAALKTISPELRKIVQNGHFEEAVKANQMLREASKVAMKPIDIAAKEWLEAEPKPANPIPALSAEEKAKEAESKEQIAVALEKVRSLDPEDAAKVLLFLGSYSKDELNRRYAVGVRPWMLAHLKALIGVLPETGAARVQVLAEAGTVSATLFQVKRAELMLKLNEHILPGIVPAEKDPVEVGGNTRKKATPLDSYHHLTFVLNETKENAPVWQQLRKELRTGRKVRLSLLSKIGDTTFEMPTAIVPEMDAPGDLNTGWHPLTLEFVANWQMFRALSLVALVLLIFVWRARGTNLLGDTDAVRRPDGLSPFSLGRTQMAFWFLVVVGTYIFLWVWTGKLYVLNNTCLWLIGIGSGTALGAAVITNTGQNAHTGKRWPWEATKDMNHTDTMHRLEYFELILGARTPATVEAAVNAANAAAHANAVLEAADAAVKAADAVGKPAAVADAAALSAPFKALDADIAAAEKTVIKNWSAKTKIPEACNPAEMLLLRDTGEALSKQIIAARNMRGGAVGWFFDDVLTEGPHYSFHKFQMFVWTLVSGVIFISSVIDNWVVPDFDTTMLALMGISSGTYLGFKLPPARSATT